MTEYQVDICQNEAVWYKAGTLFGLNVLNRIRIHKSATFELPTCRAERVFDFPLSDAQNRRQNEA